MSAQEDLQMITVEGAAEILAVSKTTVYGLIAAGELRASKIGRAVRIRLVDLREFVDRNDWAVC
jgi:excisionase family DNA binding protein